MTTYLVIWSIEIDADNPRDAALEAQAIQRDLSSIATAFNTVARCECGGYHEEDTENVDLMKVEPRVH